MRQLSKVVSELKASPVREMYDLASQTEICWILRWANLILIHRMK